MPLKTTAIVVGMGLGNYQFDRAILQFYPAVIDADLFGDSGILSLLRGKDDAILTLYPKECRQLLALAKIGNYSIAEIQANRFELARVFSQNLSQS